MRAAELFDLTGQTALVTGASSGLGDRFARTLAANGARVIGLARRKDRLDALVADIAGKGGEALACAGDVTNPAEVERAFDEAQARFGPVTILINNAGSAEAVRVLEQTGEFWRATMDLNLNAVHSAAQIAARRMIAAGVAGNIVNIASILGFGVTKGLASYAVSKAAVVQLTKAMALELAGSRIRVNAIAPGYIATEINRDYLDGPGSAMKRAIPLRRFGTPEDLDGVLLLLASDAGRFITGATYVADGGQTLAIPG